ncbi:TcfC E-set like domain-containing protein [Enterobacter sp. Bisph1]|uniref:TcfC E-set like domain-containing protein n=1 Tax=Enterobacter sp. Bisph1 TaxID=1274399 RepID=UPI000A7271C0|nr:TcfC E-set like domain-containing protein [Enterobacter sp. Bisph1]
MSLAANMHRLPEDFRQYFYDAEMIVQVFLNDSRLFDAAITLNEDGSVRLLRILDDAPDADAEARDYWNGILSQGIGVGKCTQQCPSGLMEVQYSLDQSTLKLFTAHYEKSRTSTRWIPLPENAPAGMIMFNDASFTHSGDYRSWGLNSSLTSSMAGWSQKVAFQSTGSESDYGYYSHTGLYELFTQKELQGSFVRLGFFTPDNDTSNVQTTGFGSDTVIGAMWGSSDSLLADGDTVSAWPVYITGRNQSIAEVWRDGRMIYTQQLQAGVQALDTRRLPGGIYDITIRIIENGQTVDTQQAQIYKPQGWHNPDRRWRMNLWSGQHRTFDTGTARRKEDNPFAVGGGVDLLAHPRAVLGISAAATEKAHHARLRMDLTLSPKDAIFAQYTLGDMDYMSNQNTDIRYYRTIPGGGSASLFWRSTMTDNYGHITTTRQRGDVWGGSLSLRLPMSTSLTVNGQYTESAWRRGAGVDVSTTTMATLWGRDANFRLSLYDRPGFNGNQRDYGASFGLSISLAPSANHIVSAETGMNQDEAFSSLNYQWQPDNSALRSLGAGVSFSPNNTVVNGNGSFDTQHLSADGFVQHSSRENTSTLGGNLSQALVIGGGKVASVNGNNQRGMDSALIVDIDTDAPNANVIASSPMAEIGLKPGRNIVPAELWKKNTVQFTASGGESLQVFPPRDSMQMQRGSVKYIKVQARQTMTLVGILLDESGNVLVNRTVKSDLAEGFINSEGVATVDSGLTNKILTVKARKELPAMECTLPENRDTSKKVQFLNEINCQVVEAEENR